MSQDFQINIISWNDFVYIPMIDFLNSQKVVLHHNELLNTETWAVPQTIDKMKPFIEQYLSSLFLDNTTQCIKTVIVNPCFIDENWRRNKTDPYLRKTKFGFNGYVFSQGTTMADFQLNDLFEHFK